MEGRFVDGRFVEGCFMEGRFVVVPEMFNPYPYDLGAYITSKALIRYYSKWPEVTVTDEEDT